jgi:alkylation response protein AidB-like acyl-CoA dehydrogenase
MYNNDQESLSLLRASAEDFCAGISLSTAKDPSKRWWTDIAELGWLAVAVPEHAGGAGLGIAGAGVIAHELGKAGYARAYAETVALAHALRRGRDADLIPEHAELDQVLKISGSGALQLGLVKPMGPHIPDEGIVADVCAQGLNLLTFNESDGLRLHQIGDATRRNLVKTTSRGQDLLVCLGKESFGSDCIAHDLAQGEAALRVWQDATMLHRVLAASQLVGAVQTSLAIMLDYTRIRSQFGHLIGSYQAVQHAAVDILAASDAAELLVNRALAAIDADSGQHASLAAAATAYAREISWTSLMKTYDVLGGVGFIEVHPINRYTRAVLLTLASIGTASECEDATASHVRPGHWLAA